MIATQHLCWISFLIIVGLSISSGSEVREVWCHKCSWIGTHDLDDDKKKSLDEQRKDMDALSTPIDNPLTTPYIQSLTPLNELQLAQCEKCKLANGYCASWTFLVNDVPQNATYMCVRGIAGGEPGVYHQDMPSGEVKKVVLCNKDYCNAKSLGLESPTSLALLLVGLLFCFFWNRSLDHSSL